MTRRRRMALAGFTGGLTAAAALLLVTLWPDRPARTLTLRDHDGIYRALLASDFSDLGFADGLAFVEAHGMLPPDEAERERHWLIYATFDTPGKARHRIAYQIVTGHRRAQLAESFRAAGRCVPYFDTGWECVGKLGDAYVKGDVFCLERGCTARRHEAEALLRLGTTHLERVLASH